MGRVVAAEKVCKLQESESYQGLNSKDTYIYYRPK